MQWVVASSKEPNPLEQLVVQMATLISIVASALGIKNASPDTYIPGHQRRLPTPEELKMKMDQLFNFYSDNNKRKARK